MKTRLLLLCALMGVLVACDKNANEPQQVAFRKGQQVTLRVNASLNQDVQAPRRVSGTIASDGALDFAWEEGDEIQVIVGGTPATFTMTSFTGASAEFTGAMPADGESFDVTYTPANAPTAEQIKQQTAASLEEVQTIDKKYFSLEAKNCQLGNNISLRWIYSAIKVSMQADGFPIDIKLIRIMSSDAATTASVLCFDHLQEVGVEETYVYIVINDFTALTGATWGCGVYNDDKVLSGDESPFYICGEKNFKNLNQFEAGNIYVLPTMTVQIVYDPD